MATAKKSTPAKKSAAKKKSAPPAFTKVQLPAGFRAITSGDYGEEWEYEKNPLLQGVVTGAVREVDMVARWGGEEFLLVLRDAAPAELPALTRRILGEVRGVSLLRPDGAPLELTASLGWCEFPSFDLDGARWEEVLHLADMALYDAKASGRDNARGWLWNPAATATAIDAALSSRERPVAEVARLVVA